MALEIGTRVGIYEVTGKLGEGGMGEVYRAHDTTLDRDVALKVLSEAFTADADRLSRFQREAKVLASLNHPNIGAIHGLESAGETEALVLELIEGPTLADRIAEGAIPVDEALTIAQQIAEALEAAHDQGIVHRDLKPANVKVRPDGTVKVLDFGLAKAVTSGPSGTSGADNPTISLTGATQMGMIIGTAAYMAPEQAKGKAVDKRADIWAFGVVLYEILTGRRAFSGEDVSDTLAAILRDKVQMDQLPSDTPPRVRRILNACLQRDPKQRIHDIGDLRLALEGAFETTVTEVAESTATDQQPVWRQALTWALPALLFGGLVVGGVLWIVSEPPNSSVARALLTPPPSVPLAAVSFDNNVTLTPDGSQVVYRGSLDGRSHLFVRQFDDFEATPLSGLTSNPRNPFISPDGNWIGFFDASSSVQRVSIRGGPPLTITDNLGGPPRGGSWGPDDTIVYATAAPDAGLLRVPVGGGEPEVLTMPNGDQGEINHWWPEFLPGGQHVLFTIQTSGPLENAQIAVLSLETGEYEVLFPGGSGARYMPSGHIVYGVNGTLRAVEFDLATLTVTSDPIPVADGVLMGPTGASNFSVGQDGSFVYISGSVSGTASIELAWVDRSGREEVLALAPSTYFDPMVSPDGTQVALRMINEEGNSDVYIYDVARNNLTQFTFHEAPDCCPVWSPDGERIVFTSARDGGFNGYVKNADGTGDVALVAEAGGWISYDWSDDGETVVFSGGNALYSVSVSDGVITPIVESDFSEGRPALSPDEQWIAYESDEDGDLDVYVRPFPDIDNGKWKVSTDGGASPLWSPDGTELYYLYGDTMMAASITTEPSFNAGNPIDLFEGRYFGVPVFKNFDLSPDGTRFLMMKQSGNQSDDSLAPLGLVVVFNWFEELQRLFATS